MDARGSATHTEIVEIAASGPALDPTRHGRKACGLRDLLALGLRVPPAFVVAVDTAAEIAVGVETGVVTESLSELAAAVDRLGGTRFAVRSGAAISLPGAFETVLDVEGPDVPEAVATVVASTKVPRIETIIRAMGIDEVPPTAVIVQRQVEATADERSGAGVATSCDPVTGADGLCGSVAWQTRGDAVMAGTVAVDGIATVERRCPDVSAQLRSDAARLEETFGSPVELEFAIESGVLWYLQLRTFDRPEPLATDEPAPGRVLATGRPASAGVATGELHIDVDDALDAIDAGRPVVIALTTSSPGDVPVMVRSAGVLTLLGGPESHAAVVTRGAEVPAVVSVHGLAIGDDGIEIDGVVVKVGRQITVDGTRGEIRLASS